MKKVFLSLSIVFLSLLLFACGGQEEPSEPTATRDVVLTYASWNLGSPDSEDPNMERLMIEAFMEAHPDIEH
jgi:ABC-type glycerol-3-phosphate transport system substrate-binding protein